jgi:large subunit ribosomal protein L18
MDKKLGRMRRTKKIRAKIKELQMPRLCVHRTPRNIYAQVILPDGKVVVVASTLEKEIKQECSYGGNIVAAVVVGKKIAQRAKKAGVDKVAFDRSGFKYHGRVLSLANAAREHGLEF